MMEEFYQYLERAGIKKASDVFGILQKFTFEKLIKFAIECYTLTEISRSKTEAKSFFNFSASTSISGGVRPCSNVDCRIRNVYELSAFSALYANKVFIPNFFEHIYDHNFTFKNENQFFFFLNRLNGDVIVMLYLKPLIKAGIININPQTKLICKHCLSKALHAEEKIKKSLKNLEKGIINDLIKNITFTLDTPKSIILDGVKNYIGAEALRFGVLPKQLSRYKTKIPYTFKANEIKKLKLYQLFLYPIFDDLLLQKYTMWAFDVAYLTNRGIEIDIINKLESAKDDKGIEKTMVDGLIHDLPFIKNADISKLLKVRKREEGAFALYRDSVRKTINEIKGEKNRKKVEQAVKQIILPEVRKIERIVKTHRNYFSGRLKRKVIFNSIVFTAGLFANKAFGTDINTIFQATGLYLLKELYQDATSIKDIPLEAKQSDYYFLWKLKESL